MLGPADGRRTRGRADGRTDAVIHELVRRQTELSPDAIALDGDGTQLSYRELDTRADVVAARLRRLSVGVESRVAVALPRSSDFVVAALAVLKAGGAYVPVDPAYPAERQAFMLTDSGCCLMLTADPRAPGVAGIPVLTLADPDRDPAQTAAGPVRARAGNLAYIIYTSGSTGTPKGVAVSHGSVVDLLRADPRLGIAPGDKVAQLAPTAFDASIFEIWCTLARGGTVVLLAGSRPTTAELAAALRARRPDWLFLTTGLFHLLVDHDPDALSSVGVLIAGGDVLSPQHMRIAAKLVRGRAYAAYGPTETTVFTSLHTADGSTGPERVPLGSALRSRRMHILGDGMHEVPTGQAGEIYIGGAGLAREYHQRPGLTAARFVPDPFAGAPGARLYRTGDRGRRLPDGEIEFLGRVDRQVKVRGFRVELGEIEAALNAHEMVGAAAAVVVDDHTGRRLVAYAAAAGAADLTIAELRVWLARWLPEYMLPTNYVLLDVLPLDPNGKVDRAALPAPWKARANLSHLNLPPFAAPSGDLQEAIAATFVDALAIDEVGVDDNFFALGGDSLRSVRVLDQLRRHGIEVGVREFFSNPTVARLTALAARGRPDAGAAGDLRVPPC